DFRKEKDDRVIRLAEVSTGKDLREYRASWFVFSPDRKTLAYGGANEAFVRLAEVHTGKELHQFGGHKGQQIRVAFSPDGLTLATTDDHTLRLIDLATGRARELPRPEGQSL